MGLGNAQRAWTVQEYAKKYEELQVEIKRLQTIIDHRAEDLEIKAKYERLQAESEEQAKKIEKLKRICVFCG